MRRALARAAPARIARLAAACLAAVACASTPPPAPAIRKLLVFPLNVVVPMPTGLEPGAASVSEALDTWLVAQGLVVESLPVAEARAAWVAAAQALRAEVGEAQMGFEGAARVCARTLHRDRSFDALLLPWLALRRAKVQGRTVSWDGVTRTMRVVGDTSTQTHFLLDDFSADAAAPSLQVAVFSGDGAKLFDGVGGLDVVHTMVIQGDPPKIGEQILPASQMLSDHALVNEGIALALAPLLRAPPPGR
jgi:hypothetical protein